MEENKWETYVKSLNAEQINLLYDSRQLLIALLEEADQACLLTR